MAETPRAAISGELHSVAGGGVVRMQARYATDIDQLWSALTDPQRLARWYGDVTGDLRVGGEFTAFVPSSGWDGRGRIDACDPPRQLKVAMWEPDRTEEPLAVDLVSAGDHTMLLLEKRGIGEDLAWAYAAGWHAHLEDLAAHLEGSDRADLGARWNTRFDELESTYRALKVVPLDR